MSGYWFQGKACAKKFAASEAKLILIGRRKERLIALEKELLEEFPSTKIHHVAMSVTDYEAVSALPKDLPSEFQAVEVLVNNAGLALGVTSVDKNAVHDAVQVVNTNVLGVVAFCSAFVPGMIERNAGHIINMGSVAVKSHRSVYFRNIQPSCSRAIMRTLRVVCTMPASTR